ncbi:MAG: DNA topoisomerase I [Candidatus Micrarchaeota archaeon]
MKIIIAEKPIAAKRIADILGKNKAVKLGPIQAYQLSDSIVIPLKGHVLDVDFPKAMNNWQNTALKDLVDANIEYTPSLAGIKKALSKYAKEAELLIIATDYDREGESIGKEAIDMVKAENPRIKIKRAKFSALTEEDVKQAFENLSDFDFNLADAADSRREIDLIWGAVLTRYISLASNRLGRSFLSVGRVQTPALALVVDREKEIKAFEPKDFWTVSIDCVKNSQDFIAVYEQEKLFDKVRAERTAALKSNTALVRKVEKKSQKANPPAPFNTTEFMRAAANLGIQPQRAMSIAEKLYMEGLISYPRTDNTYYPASLKLKDVLKKISAVSDFKEYAEKLMKKKTLIPSFGKKETTDHPPIYPVEKADKKKLEQQDWKIYELVCRRFMATLSEPAEMELTRADLDYCTENFVANGKVILKAGWREVYPYSKSEDKLLPELAEGEKVKVKGIKMEQKQTKPKPRYSAAALIKLMEDAGIGTKSTRHEILQKLVNRGYITGNQNFTPSEVAFVVIDTLEKYAEEITSPEMTAQLEKEMDEVEKAEKKKTDVVANSRAMLHKVLSKLDVHNQNIGQNIKNAVIKDDLVGKCPLCGDNLKIIRTHRGTRFVGCSGYAKGCRCSYPLPAKGKITVLGKLCPDCNLQVISVQYFKKRPFEMCINHKCKSKANWGKNKPAEKKDESEPPAAEEPAPVESSEEEQ